MGSLIVVTLLAALLCCFPSSKANKIPLVIDTDLGRNTALAPSPSLFVC